MCKHNWWIDTVFYQIYMPSFRDGNDDGIGDFIGLTEKLDYLSELGINGLWLTPFYLSPKIDNGYDISHYTEIDEQYGSQEDFSRFITEAKKREIKVIIDIVINHTSTEHEWFIESSRSKHSDKRDWYVWRDEPNNWESFFGGSAWEYDDQTDQYYYHSFAKEQADLNWNNPEVVKEIKRILNFWIDQGVDGFRLDVINNLTVTKDFKNNPIDKASKQIHKYDKDQEGLDVVLKDLVNHIKTKKDTALLVGEISSDELAVINHYAQDGLFDLTFNFNIGSMAEFDIPTIFNEIRKMADLYKEDSLPTLFFGSHDLNRSWDRLADNNVNRYKTLLVFLLFSKGVPFIYYGEEWGMRNYIPENIDGFRDVQGINAYDEAIKKGESEERAFKKALEATRDGARTPFYWADENSENKEYWIGQSEKNLHSQTIFEFYQEMIALRKSIDLSNQDYNELALKNQCLFFKRDNIHVYLNFGTVEEELVVFDRSYQILTAFGEISSIGDNIKLGSYSCLILQSEKKVG